MWLDAIFTREDCVRTDLCVHPPNVSDHNIVEFTFPFFQDTPSYMYLASQVRGWMNLDKAGFRAALLDVTAIANPSFYDLRVADIFATYEATTELWPHRSVPSVSSGQVSSMLPLFVVRH